MAKNLSNIFFKYRSYTPLPFLIVMLIFQRTNLLSLLIGFVILLIGELFRFWGVSYAGSETRTTAGVGATYLVVSGAFAHVRNPLYLGNMLIYLGIGIMSLALFPYLQIFALLFFYFQYSQIIKEEEKFLLLKFGDAYKDYLLNVPKLIPKFTPYKKQITEQPPYNPRAGLKSEIRTLQAILSVTLILVILFLVKN
ncbi:isoprenylcysteine carboxylmethyltransferase family protein [Melioribacteraceae bacterium 4301-Me]|uniref:methyltransferase family protein n=1 Tax=Pyranulibacter aquaticus TaxID=3163344 RepID=UPI00359B238C